jgi:hypothetical protein
LTEAAVACSAIIDNPSNERRMSHHTVHKYTLIATCKRLSLDPFAYQRDLFGRIAAHPRKSSSHAS